MNRFFRVQEVECITGLSRSSIYRLAAQGGFPKPVKLSQRSSAWREEDLKKWVETRPVSGGEADA